MKRFALTLAVVALAGAVLVAGAQFEVATVDSADSGLKWIDIA